MAKWLAYDKCAKSTSVGANWVGSLETEITTHSRAYVLNTSHEDEMSRPALFCPVDHTELTLRPNGKLCCKLDHAYPIVEGVPVLLREDVEQTIGVARASIARAW